MQNAEAIQELFARHNLRCTRQRRALYLALCSTKSHPTADQLFQQVGGAVADLSLATVYNTLDAFCDAGLARKLPGLGSHGSDRYDATVSDHLHARDESSGTLCDVPEDLSAQLLAAIPQETLDAIEQQLGFQIKHVNVELIGAFRQARQQD